MATLTPSPETNDSASSSHYPPPQSPPTSQLSPFLFQVPQESNNEQEILDHIPRYLFRAYCLSTAGETGIVDVKSSALTSESRAEDRADLFSKPRSTAAKLLHAHLTWTGPHEHSSNLVSWSSSLLFLLQYCFYRHTTQSPRYALSEICLLVVDTRDFPRGDEKQWHQWARAVVNLQKEFRENVNQIQPSELRKALVIATACFGDKWVLPMTVMLLSLKARLPTDRFIVDGIKATFTSEEIDECNLGDMPDDPDGLPEVGQFMSIIRKLHDAVSISLTAQMSELSMS